MEFLYFKATPLHLGVQTLPCVLPVRDPALAQYWCFPPFKGKILSSQWNAHLEPVLPHPPSGTSWSPETWNSLPRGIESASRANTCLFLNTSFTFFSRANQASGMLTERVQVYQEWLSWDMVVDCECVHAKVSRSCV